MRQNSFCGIPNTAWCVVLGGGHLSCAEKIYIRIYQAKLSKHPLLEVYACLLRTIISFSFARVCNLKERPLIIFLLFAIREALERNRQRRYCSIF